jgi:hypothetical protein
MPENLVERYSKQVKGYQKVFDPRRKYCEEK